MYLVELKLSKLIKNQNYYFNKKYNKRGFNYQRKLNINYKFFYLFIPFQWNLLFLVNKYYKYIYIYSNIYFIWILIPVFSWNIFFDFNTHVLVINNIYVSNFFNIYIFNILNLFTSFNVLHFRKIKFKGKGYYIYKNIRNTVTPQFGFSHRHYIYGYFISIKFKNKTNVFLFSISYWNIIFYSFLIKFIRPINIFTGRGIRFTRDKIFKKAGKISSYR